MIHCMRRTDTLILIMALSFGAVPGWTAAAQANLTTADDAWQACLVELRDKSVAEGIGLETAENVLNRVEKLPRVISADRSQPEFTETFTDYYQNRVNDYRVDKGRELLATHATLLRTNLFVSIFP